MAGQPRLSSRLSEPSTETADGPHLDVDHPRHAEAIAELRDIVRFALPAIDTGKPSAGTGAAPIVRPMALGETGLLLAALSNPQAAMPDGSDRAIAQNAPLQIPLVSNQNSLSGLGSEMLVAGGPTCQGTAA